MPEWVFFILDKIVLSLLVGIVTSILFLLILSRYRPIIEISQNIAKRYEKDIDKNVYSIKVINKTKYPIVDVRVELILKTPVQTANGEVWRVRKIPLRIDSLLSLQKFNKNDDNARFAYRFATESDVDIIWKDEHQKITFRIFAKHSLSGFGGFFEIDYGLKRVSIIEGIFSKGNNFDIK